jgi:tRNA(fMet)-specific endonuclease VapC
LIALSPTFTSDGGKQITLSTLLVDTNVVSFLMKKIPLGLRYENLLRGNRLAISFMTLAELYEGAYRGNWGEKRLRKLEREVGHYLVFSSDPEICRRWGDVRFQRRKQPISAEDAWIAATALTYECPLVTHNSQDFKDIPRLRVLTARDDMQ